MSTYLAITVAPRIVKGGGPITKGVYKSHATQLWQKGALLVLSSGLVTPALDTSSAAAALDTDAVAAASPKVFVALEDHLVAGTVDVAVQEITRNTVFECQILGGTSTEPIYATQALFAALIGTKKAGYALGAQATSGVTVDGAGIWGVDIDNTTKPLFVVQDVQANWDPFNVNVVARYPRVWVKLIGTLFAS